MSSRLEIWHSVTATTDGTDFPCRQQVYRSLSGKVQVADEPYRFVLVIPDKWNVITNHSRVTAIYKPWRFFIWEGIPREVEWDGLSDNLRYIVRASKWWSRVPIRIRNRKTLPRAPGGYEDERWYTLEVLEDM